MFHDIWGTLNQGVLYGWPWGEDGDAKHSGEEILDESAKERKISLMHKTISSDNQLGW